MKRKTFVHIGYSHAPDDVRILEKECKSLSKYPNSEVIYITSNKNSNASLECYNDNDVRVITIPLRGKRGVRLLNYLKEIKSILLGFNADIYHIHEPWLLPLVRSLKKKNKKVIFDSHEFYYEQFKSEQRLVSNIIAHIYKIYENIICKKIDAVIYPCTIRGKNFFENKCKKTMQIGNYVILNESLLRYNVPQKNFKPILCYAGSISESRGITQIIKAAYQSKSNLLLAGTFASDKYKAEVESMKEFQCVEFRGKCTPEEVEELYNESTIGMSLILPKGQYYLVDNMSTKVYEYMQKKMPVIISNTNFTNEVMQEYKFGIPVNPQNLVEIVEAISYLTNNTVEAKKMGEEGYRAVVEKYNWGLEEKKLLKLYGELLAEKDE